MEWAIYVSIMILNPIQSLFFSFLFKMLFISIFMKLTHIQCLKKKECMCQGVWGERWGEDSSAGEWDFNNKIKQRGRQAGKCLHSQHNTHTMKDYGSTQDYRHQEAK